MSYAIYLRKSRADVEAEARGEGETLARHEHILLELAGKRGLDVGAVYKELVSGETIAARPVMQKLMQEVGAGSWDGVICMEIERLARGDTMDQGLVSQTFKFSGTKIVTPSKVYDPNNEFDEEYFEFSLFMSRREYKTIRRRMQAGRLASVREGNYIGSQPPYGYKKVRLYDEKCFTLEPIEGEADTVKLIFELYTRQDMGYSKIATYLNKLGIPPKRTDSWSASSVKDIIGNPVYCGKLRWDRRKTKKTLVDGKIIQSRPTSEGTVFEGKHPPIVSTELWEKAQAVQAKQQHTANHFQNPLKNHFVGLLYCEQCGHAMVRRPYKNAAAYYMCVHKGCGCKASCETEIDEALIKAIAKQYNRYRVTPENRGPVPAGNGVGEIKKAALTELEKLKRRREKLYDLLEQEVYTAEVFAERSAVLSERVKELEKIIESLKDGVKAPANIQEACITLKSILDDYGKITDAGKRNVLLKTAVKRISYLKTTGGRYNRSDMTLHVDYIF
ncbi:MAG: recombinase family protein [Prevotella sp.]|nr:recombinase family protein [Prevotella sp.]